jgi:hypothetical protein
MLMELYAWVLNVEEDGNGVLLGRPCTLMGWISEHLSITNHQAVATGESRL